MKPADDIAVLASLCRELELARQGQLTCTEGYLEQLQERIRIIEIRLGIRDQESDEEESF